MSKFDNLQSKGEEEFSRIETQVETVTDAVKNTANKAEAKTGVSANFWIWLTIFIIVVVTLNIFGK